MEQIMNLKFTNDFWLFVLPIILMLIDILTGYYNAYEKKEVSSSKMRDGLGKKVAELCYIVIGVLFGFAFGIKPIAYFISIYISYMELVSINENCKKLGVSMPNDIENELKKEIKSKNSAETNENSNISKKE